MSPIERGPGRSTQAVMPRRPLAALLNALPWPGRSISISLAGQMQGAFSRSAVNVVPAAVCSRALGGLCEKAGSPTIMMDAYSLLWLNKQNQELKHCLKLLAMFRSNLKYSLGPSSIVEPRGSSKPVLAEVPSTTVFTKRSEN